MAESPSVFPATTGGRIEVVSGGGQCGGDLCMAGGADGNKIVLIDTKEYAIRSPSERLADNKLTPAEDKIISAYKFDKVIDSTDPEVILEQKNKILDSIYNNDCLNNTEAGTSGKCEPMRAILNRLIEVMLNPKDAVFDKYIEGKTDTNSKPQIVFTISIPFEMSMFESKTVAVPAPSGKKVGPSGEDVSVALVSDSVEVCEGNNCVDTITAQADAQAAEQAAKQAAEQAAKQAAEQAAKQAAEQAAKQAAEQAGTTVTSNQSELNSAKTSEGNQPADSALKSGGFNMTRRKKRTMY
jgi:hypothetical protein